MRRELQRPLLRVAEHAEAHEHARDHEAHLPFVANPEKKLRQLGRGVDGQDCQIPSSLEQWR